MSLEYVRAELTSGPQRVLSWHLAASEWCVKEALGHLIKSERRGFATRIRMILDSNNPLLDEWGPAVVARERGDCERDLTVLLGEFSCHVQ